MGQLKWYRHEPGAFLTGTAGMTNELVGAYIRLLNLIYLHDGKLRDDAKFICRWLECRPQRWRKLRTELLERGKLHVLNGHLINDRADREIAHAARRAKTKRDAADARWNGHRRN